MTFFSAKQISAGYGKQNVIQEISFSLEEGCLMGILGANGSGKTTLLKALCGIIPHSGSCTLDCIPLESLSSRQLAKLVSYIPQRSGISIDISARDVVLMGFNPNLGLLKQPTKQMEESAIRALQQVGLEHKIHTNYLHLSEGQKQLCILARTLVSGCRLLVLDEPESALDFRFRHHIFTLLKNWVCSGKRAALVTLHDPMLALNGCDKILLLSGGSILGTICPKEDSLLEMERLLCAVYGNISLQRCVNRGGDTQIVMLREDTE